MPRYEQRACLECGMVRKVQMRGHRPVSLRCHPCGAKHRAATSPGSWRSREEHPRWKGGRHITSLGYVQVVVPLGDPFLVMADSRGRVYEHRLVMAVHLGRPLVQAEQVHHKNGDKQDNRIENLELTSLPERNCVRRRHDGCARSRADARQQRDDDPHAPDLEESLMLTPWLDDGDIRLCPCGCGESFSPAGSRGRPRAYFSPACSLRVNRRRSRDALHLHHVKPWATYPELRFDPTNVVALCRSCHHDAHRKGGGADQ